MNNTDETLQRNALISARHLHKKKLFFSVINCYAYIFIIVGFVTQKTKNIDQNTGRNKMYPFKKGKK